MSPAFNRASARARLLSAGSAIRRSLGRSWTALVKAQHGWRSGFGRCNSRNVPAARTDLSYAPLCGRGVNGADLARMCLSGFERPELEMNSGIFVHPATVLAISPGVQVQLPDLGLTAVVPALMGQALSKIASGSSADTT